MRGFLVLLALAVAGCAADVDARKCEGYGFTPGTEAYANCLMMADQSRRSAAAAVAAQNPYLRY